MSISVKIYYSIDDLDQAFIRRWRMLGKHALSPNAYLTPEFIIPAQKLLTPNIDIVIISIEKKIINEVILIGLGVFQIVQPSFKIPFKYLTTYRSTHSFLGGILLHEHHGFAMEEMLNYIKSLNKWSGVQFSEFKKTNEIVNINHNLLNNDIHWFEFNDVFRAILYPKNSGLLYLDNKLNKKYLKNLRRKKRNLKKLGDLSWNIVYKKNITNETINEFLTLENSGWKGDSGTSLLSNVDSSNFFKKIVIEFKDNNDIFFTEIKLNNKTIASTCNFVSGNVGFAFKLAWNEDYSKYSIGILNEIELIINAPDSFSHLSYIDGSNMPGSFLEKLWINHVTLVTGMYSLSRLSCVYLNFLYLIKSIKRKVLLYTEKLL